MSVTTVVPPASIRDGAAPAPTGDASPRPAKRKGVLHYLGVGISAGLLALVLLVAVLVIGIPAVSGSTPYTILTGSMQPTLPPGTLVVVKKTPVDDIRIGDVITYQLKSGEPEVVTHRVIAIQQPNKVGGSVSFITRGDANSASDPLVRAVQVRGKVWYSIPLIGWVNNVVTGDSRAILVPILATGLFLYAGWMLVGHLIERRRRARAAARGELAEQEAEAAVASRL